MVLALTRKGFVDVAAPTQREHNANNHQDEKIVGLLKNTAELL
ncbi:MAG: hypothetical protein RBJ76_04600 [Stenomitos frigidus ULC029]